MKDAEDALKLRKKALEQERDVLAKLRMELMHNTEASTKMDVDPRIDEPEGEKWKLLRALQGKHEIRGVSRREEASPNH